MTFIPGTKLTVVPPPGIRGRRVGKGGARLSTPRGHTPLGNAAKERRIPTLVMWYLSVVDHWRHIFLTPKETTLKIWLDDERKVGDGKIQHSAKATQWQRFDAKHHEFSSDPRNVRFGLSTSGMHPLIERTSNHNTWLVILTLYNIPTWLHPKRKHLLLTILTQGPKQLGIHRDVFLEPLMEEMEKLWRFEEPMFVC